MKLFKPKWINHDEGQGIFSVDIHPVEQKIVTGGQSENRGGLFIIWNLKSVIESDSCDKENPRMLCRIEQAACINCVRWSKSGKFLAAAGDEQFVTIWCYYGRSKSTGIFGSEKATNVEHWKCTNTLRGHSGDILHIEWAPLDNYLASCSVDNTVVIWNALKFPEKVSVLSGHSDMVKGLTWDPVGRFIASQSADKTVKVWSTSTWECVKTVKEPFNESSNTTHVLRLNWGRDGQWLITAHAMNSGGPTAQLIERNGWQSEKDFVGHRKAVTCVRWSPVLYSKKVSKSKKTAVIGCFALGSRDRGISIWQPCFPRPRAVVQHLFSQGVLDLSWSGDGLCLMGCSSDGSVACFIFSQEEMGERLSDKETDEYLKGLYGRVPKRLDSSGVFSPSALLNGPGSDIVDNPLVLKAQQDYKKQKALIFSVSKTQSAHPSQSQNVPVENGQKENFRPTDVTGSAVPSISMERLSSTKQQETKTADGRRRIKPLFLGSAVEVAPVVPHTPVAASFGHNTNVADMDVELTSFRHDDSRIQTSTPCISGVRKDALISEQRPEACTSHVKPLENGPVSTTFSSGRLKRVPINMEAKKTKRLKKSKFSHDREPQKTESHVQEETERISDDRPGSSINSVCTISLPVPEKKENLSVTLNLIGGRKGNFSVLVMNEAFPGGLTKIVCAEESTTVWESVLSSPAACISASSHMVCVCCFDRSLTVLSACSGRKKACQVMLDSCASFLCAVDWLLLVLTANGFCHVWNWKDQVAVISGVSVLPLLAGDSEVSVSSGSLTELGIPVLVLSNKKCFTYSKLLQAWVVLCDGADTMTRLSSVESSAEAEGTLNTFGPLASLCGYNSKKSITTGSLVQKHPKALQAMATCALLEARMNAALALESGQEYKFWLRRYVMELVKQGCAAKLKELCAELLGPVCRHVTEEESLILGFRKRSLLKELLPVISTNPQLQRLYTEFHNELDASVNNYIM